MNGVTKKNIGEHVERQLIAHSGVFVLGNSSGPLGKVYQKYYAPIHLAVFIVTFLAVWVEHNAAGPRLLPE